MKTKEQIQTEIRITEECLERQATEKYNSIICTESCVVGSQPVLPYSDEYLKSIKAQIGILKWVLE